MKVDSISEIRIDDDGRLLVVPQTARFPYIYREAMEVAWDKSHLALCSPVPRKWDYARWFRQICDAAEAQGTALEINASTRWTNVPEAALKEFTNVDGGGAA